MRRCAPSRGSQFYRRAGAAASAVSCASSDSTTPLLYSSVADIGECLAGAGSKGFSNAHEDKQLEDIWCRALHDAIQEVTRKFEEAQQEYHAVSPNSCDGHKWKGEMIAYANAVALLESMKSRAVLVP